MATKSYDDLDAFRKDAETLRDSRGVPLDPPQNQGEMFLEDGLAIHLGLEDSEADRARAMKGSLEPAQLERAREHVRSSVEQAQAFTEQHLAQAVAAGGRGYAAGEMNVELDVVRAGQGWLMRHGDRLERKVYGAIWGRDSIDVDASFQRELFGNEALWLNAAYAAVGYEPPHPVDRPWSMVMDVAEAVHNRDVQEQLEAERLGLETAGTGPQETEPGPVDDVLAVVARARLSARRGITDFGDERPEVAEALRRADRALTNAIETLRPDAEEDPGQEQQEWTVTPEQAQATWIETTTRLRTLIDTGQYTAARNEIREMDSYLHNYTSGGTPPDSVEDEYLYGDALNRTTVPLPSVASSMVLRDIRARGELVPDFPDAKHVAATTGVHGLHVSELQRALTQPGKSPTPRTHESVAFAGAWRAATKNLGEDLVVSYDLPNAPGQALVERLDGNLDSYVSVMRTGQREVILDDVIGNRIEPAELGQRLGLDEEGANTVMTGLVEALEAAENMRQTPSTTSNSSPTADPARQVPAGPVDPLTSGHLPPHSPTSTNSPSRF